MGDLGSIPGLGRSPGGGHGSPLQYSCLENPHGQRSVVGWSCGCKESDMTEQLSTHSIKPTDCLLCYILASSLSWKESEEIVSFKSKHSEIAWLWVCFVKAGFWFELSLSFFWLKVSWSYSLEENFKTSSFIFVLEDMQSNFLRRILDLPKGVPSAQSKGNISEAFDSYIFFFSKEQKPTQISYCQRGLL